MDELPCRHPPVEEWMVRISMRCLEFPGMHLQTQSSGDTTLWLGRCTLTRIRMTPKQRKDFKGWQKLTRYSIFASVRDTRMGDLLLHEQNFEYFCGVAPSNSCHIAKTMQHHRQSRAFLLFLKIFFSEAFNGFPDAPFQNATSFAGAWRRGVEKTI